MKKNPEVFEQMLDVSEHKLTREIYKTILLSIFAGVFIAIGGLANIVVGASFLKNNASMMYFLGGCVFPIGLIAVVFFGADLFTSSCLNPYVCIFKKKYVGRLFMNLGLVFVFNFVGAILIALITWGSHVIEGENLAYLQKIAAKKLSTDYGAIFLKAIMCNILVSGAVVLSYFSKSTVGKVVLIWFPIMIFILLGYEHSVANMFYYALIKYRVSGYTVGQMAINMTVVTLGNIVGGLALGGFVILFKEKKVKEKEVF